MFAVSIILVLVKVGFIVFNDTSYRSLFRFLEGKL